jgi:ABC-type Na+ efflux pump permease subunit
LRWKLLIAASLLAAAAGAGACYAAARYLVPAAWPAAAPGWAAALPLLAPLAATTYAAIFVYRHTPRRRALQAAATALLASLLTLTALAAGSALGARTPPSCHPPRPRKTPERIYGPA